MTEYVLQTAADPCAARRLAKSAICLLGEVLSDRDLLYDIDLALLEACANVVNHAYDADSPGDLQIRLSVSPGSHIGIDVIDWGKGIKARPKDVRNAPPEAQGGRGLYIMSKLCDGFDIRQEDDRNIVHLTMKIEDSAWLPCE